MNKDELEQEFTKDGGAVVTWIRAHQKVSTIIAAVIVGLILGWVWFHR
jgi:hypothetical protein